MSLSTYKKQLVILYKYQTYLESLEFKTQVAPEKGILDLNKTGTAATLYTLVRGNMLGFNPLRVGIASLFSYKLGALMGKYNKTQSSNNAALVEAEKNKELKKVGEKIDILLEEIERLEGIKTPVATIQPQLEENTEVAPKVRTSKTYKVIKSEVLRKSQNSRYNLTGKWKKLFGYLPKDKCGIMIYGRPKNGKTHLCVQLAEYLEELLGNVLYVSAEEGREDPFKDTLERWQATFKVLYDVEGYEGIKGAIEELEPRVIVIDSKDRLKIDINRLIELKETYKSIIFIFVSQVNAKGKPRGTESIIHELSSIVKVVDGMATQEGRMAKGETQMAIFEDVVLEETE